MNMTFAQVRTFLCIVGQGSFHAVAPTPGLTQPSMPQRIRELESAWDQGVTDCAHPVGGAVRGGLWDVEKISYRVF